MCSSRAQNGVTGEHHGCDGAARDDDGLVLSAHAARHRPGDPFFVLNEKNAHAAIAASR